MTTKDLGSLPYGPITHVTCRQNPGLVPELQLTAKRAYPVERQGLQLPEVQNCDQHLAPPASHASTPIGRATSTLRDSED